MRRLIFAVAALVAAGTGSARAYSDEQMAAMSHVGQVLAGGNVCSRISPNMGMLSAVLVTYGLDLKDPAVAGVVKSKARETISAWAGKGEDAACAAVIMLYGPEGTNVPGLVQLN